MPPQRQVTTLYSHCWFWSADGLSSRGRLGRGNVFRDNAGQVDGSGDGIDLATAEDNFVYCSNSFTAAPKG